MVTIDLSVEEVNVRYRVSALGKPAVQYEKQSVPTAFG